MWRPAGSTLTGSSAARSASVKSCCEGNARASRVATWTRVTGQPAKAALLGRGGLRTTVGDVVDPQPDGPQNAHDLAAGDG